MLCWSQSFLLCFWGNWWMSHQDCSSWKTTCEHLSKQEQFLVQGICDAKGTWMFLLGMVPQFMTHFSTIVDKCLGRPALTQSCTFTLQVKYLTCIFIQAMWNKGSTGIKPRPGAQLSTSLECWKCTIFLQVLEIWPQFAPLVVGARQSYIDIVSLSVSKHVQHSSYPLAYRGQRP